MDYILYKIGFFLYTHCVINNEYIGIIKDLRIKNNLSQEQVANAVGVSRPTYTLIESGKQIPGIEETKKLASLYSIGVDSLLAGRIPDIEKYKHMILLYLRMNVTHKKDGKVTKTKLAKLLYLADFAWFYEHSKSMSGMQYRKIPYGPVPDTFFRAIDELEASGKVIIDRNDDGDKPMFLISEAESNKNEKIHSLSKEELVLLKKIGIKWQDKKTNEIVNFTHNQLPYALCRNNELIPYELIIQEDPDMVY